MKKGRPYYYVRETARVDGKPKVVNQIYLGTIERILDLVQGKGSECKKLAAQEFGALWLANLIDADVGLAALIDSVVAKGRKESSPTVGEYFLYSVFNRMVDACSKRALPQWYEHTAIQSIRPVDVELLDSKRFRDKWDRVGEKDIEKISSLFFKKIARIEPPASGCFLFDTTNYYTYMASKTESDAARGKNKEGKGWLRQVGVALLVSRGSELPLFYREYEGNRHDSKVFFRLLTEIASVMRESCSGELTVVVDKGMNSDDNITAVDAMPGVHFITTYYADDLVRIKSSQFKDDDLVSILPLRHWTDGKIRCHILTCIIALAYLRLIEIRLHRAGLGLSAAETMEQMQKLHSCLCWEDGRSKPIRMIEVPTEQQAAIMRAFGYEVSGGILQKINT